jgi:ABC-2 type transport system permease protein
MMRVLDIYFTSLKNSFAARMAYRTDFVFCCVMIFVSELLFPLITFLIYASGASFPGWSIYEIMLLQGVFMLSKGIADLLFFGIVYNTLIRVREGTYDLLLIKPVSVLFISIATGFEPDSIGTVAGGLLISYFSLHRLPQPDMVQWLRFIFIFLFSVMAMFSFAVIMAASMFKWVGNSRIYEIFDSITSFGNYPRTIFSKSFQTIISYIIPVAIIAFYPASALLGKDISGIMPAVLVLALFLVLSILFWRLMLSKYTSAGG